jgi:hypothetical protein
MPKFEVFIPAAEEAGFNVTLRVDAETWMAALKTGVQRLGEQGLQVRNILVDVQDDTSVHVTEPHSGRVFRIRELSESDLALAQPKRRPPKPAPGEPDGEKAKPSPLFTDVPGPAAYDPGDFVPTLKLQREELFEQADEGSPTARTVLELEAPTTPVTGPIGRPRQTSPKEQVEDLLAEVFERVQEVYARQDERAALYFLLDLAMEKIPAESGSVLRADPATGAMKFVAVRGPAARELLESNLVVPVGTGIVGFSASQGVSLALSDVEKDPRYYRAIAEQVNYTPRSLLCAPMITHGQVFGCLEILNKTGSSSFGATEIGLLAYIAHQGALYLGAR